MLRKLLFLILILFPLMLLAQTKFKAVGKPEKLIGGDGNYFIQPVWSPDGSKIAFTESNYIGLWLVNLDGSDLIQLSDEVGAGYDFSWSPDSREILSRVYKYEGKSRLNAIKSFKIGNENVTNISGYTHEKLGLPRWAKDNSQIYYLKDKKLETIETGRKVKFVGNVPLVYQDNSTINSDLNSSVTRLLSSGNKNTIYLNVRVSPSGQRVSYEVMGGNLFTMNIDGSDITDLGTGYNARWSPDSQYLVYMINTDDGHKFLSSDLYIIKSDGEEKINITNTSDQLEMNPCWSADGKQVVFNTYEDGAIYVMTISDR
jgi:Tol biopolymer transport system component